MLCRFRVFVLSQENRIDANLDRKDSRGLGYNIPRQGEVLTLAKALREPMQLPTIPYHNPGVMPVHLRTVAPQRRMRSQEMVIMVMPYLKASVWLYWLVL